MANLGPASVVTTNTGLAQQVFNLPNGGAAAFPFGQNALRLLASSRAQNLTLTGDTVMPLNNVASFGAVTIVVTNGLVNGASASVATASLGIFTGPGATGTGIRAAGVLTGQTSQTVVTATAASVTTLQFVTTASPNLYVNVGTALAGGTVDIFVYGYDLS